MTRNFRVAFNFADSPDFRDALATAQARLEERTTSPMVTSGASVSAAPNEKQLRIGESGQFADDNAEYPEAIEDRATKVLDFQDYFEGMA